MKTKKLKQKDSLKLSCIKYFRENYPDFKDNLYKIPIGIPMLDKMLDINVIYHLNIKRVNRPDLYLIGFSTSYDNLFIEINTNEDAEFNVFEVDRRCFKYSTITSLNDFIKLMEDHTNFHSRNISSSFKNLKI
jgi:hypothetical protein